jgi:hypothetical protein
MKILTIGSRFSPSEAREMAELGGWEWWERIKARVREDDARRQRDIDRVFAPKPTSSPKQASSDFIPSEPKPTALPVMTRSGPRITRQDYENRIIIIARNFAQGGPINFAHMEMARKVAEADVKKRGITIVGSVAPDSGPHPLHQAAAWKYVVAGVMAAGLGIALHHK